jgi:hypothetical protein
MTEDDTFKKLRQLPFEQMENLHVQNVLNMLRRRAGNAPSDNTLIYEDHGWTRQEFLNEWQRRHPKHKPD